jgi:hypothetical protein
VGVAGSTAKSAANAAAVATREYFRTRDTGAED